MRPVRAIAGTAAPLDRSDVDTDQIIPAHWLKRVERTGFGEGLFSEWRADPDFVLNRPSHRGATVLLARANFGIGSSREHAVWALLDHGFQAVVATSFGDIFRNNCTKQGLVPVTVDADLDDALFDAVGSDPSVEVVVDVERTTVRAGAVRGTFTLDDFDRQRFLNGWDDISLTMRHEPGIAAFEARRPGWLPAIR
jgi:3-isopropylmalate/(R)-2-methylmalate dehydratase small subunit